MVVVSLNVLSKKVKKNIKITKYMTSSFCNKWHAICFNQYVNVLKKGLYQKAATSGENCCHTVTYYVELTSVPFRSMCAGVL